MDIPLAEREGLTTAETVYRFGACEVRPRLRQVRLSGQPVDAQPKVLDLLLYLIENRNRVIDKDELLEKLWPGVVVSAGALTQIVRKARMLAGDDGDRQAVIKTFHRRGFRFVGALEGSAAPVASTAAPLVAVKSPEGSVAVLPFVDMSPEHDQGWFCDGLAEEIINELTQVPDLRVAARTSTFTFKNGGDAVREIGRRLGVKLVLEGSVRKERNLLRVTARLIDAGSGFHLWSERWDGLHADTLAIHAEIAQRIGAVLRLLPGAVTTPRARAVDDHSLLRRTIPLAQGSPEPEAIAS
jgi:TolB-like protein